MSARDTCPYEAPIQLVGDRWILRIVKAIHVSEQPMRFNELMAELEPVSSKTLSVKLKRLIAEDIVTKRVESTMPIVATYGLTEKGHDLMSVLDRMVEWGKRWHVRRLTPRVA